MKLLFQFVLSLLISSSITGQVADTLRIVDFQNIIINHYPLIKKANLYDEITEAYQIKGKGALDPKFTSSFDGKEFKESNYFDRWFSEVKIPTRLPVDFSAGYENNDGIFLNNEASVPSNGLFYGTLNINLIRGLMFDQQRFDIQVAELDGVKNQIEKELLIREIIFQSMNAYLEWASAHINLDTYGEYLEAIRIRHTNVINLFLNGDKPAIDTIESRVNLNTAQKYYLDANDNLIWKTQKLSLFLWDDEGNPLLLKTEVVPELLDDVIASIKVMSIMMDPNFIQDPIIRKQKNKIDAIALENKLVREDYKPQLDIKFNTIFSAGSEDFSLTYNANDYKIGARLEIPILNRKTKGQVRLNDAVMDQLQIDQEFYLAKMSNEYEGLMRSLLIKENVIDVLLEKIRNSTSLYEAENFKFNLGESSIFLLNQRETKLLEARIEHIKALKNFGYLLNDLYYFKLGQGQL